MNKDGASMKVQQRIVWIGLAALALTLPIWFDAVLAPGDRLFFWRWTEFQMTAESLVSVSFLVAAVAGYFFFRKGAGDWPQWPLLRIGLGVWIFMVTLFVGFSVWMYSIGEQRMAAEYHHERFDVRAIEVQGMMDEPRFLIVMSCDQSLIHQRVIHIDQFMGGDDVSFALSETENYTLNVDFTNEGRVLHAVALDLDSLHRQCLRGESPRPSPFALSN